MLDKSPMRIKGKNVGSAWNPQSEGLLNRNSERIPRRFCLTAVLRGLQGSSMLILDGLYGRRRLLGNVVSHAYHTGDFSGHSIRQFL